MLKATRDGYTRSDLCVFGGHAHTADGYHEEWIHNVSVARHLLSYNSITGRPILSAMSGQVVRSPASELCHVCERDWPQFPTPPCCRAYLQGTTGMIHTHRLVSKLLSDVYVEALARVGHVTLDRLAGHLSQYYDLQVPLPHDVILHTSDYRSSRWLIRLVPSAFAGALANQGRDGTVRCVGWLSRAGRGEQTFQTRSTHKTLIEGNTPSLTPFPISSL